jgi:hypothetical protein
LTRRHGSLIPLTHDHHHTLAQARRLLDISKLEDVTQRRNIANDFINFYFGRAVRHFHEEEELFFAPLVDHPQARDLVVRAVSDHLRLHALVRSIKRQISEGEVDARLLAEISTLVVRHVALKSRSSSLSWSG